MSANDLLILFVGLFCLIIGVLYLMDSKKKNKVSSIGSMIAIAVVTIGVFVTLAPVVDYFEGEDETENSSTLRGADQFDLSKPQNSGSYEEASKYYGDAVKYWNNERAGYDSTEIVMKYLDRSISIFETAEAYTARGQLKVQLGLMDKGLLDYNRAIELKDTYGNAYYNRATVYYILGDVAKACEDWKKALELGMPNTDQAIQSFCN